ncbi:MAG: type IX secretion system protein PorD [Flavobacteriales bacterium]|jgi:hypothetical protein|tara:strand:- start:1275 stop:2180 length:906 start_codon:yes stop_codon:yes gene_type:complete
MKINLLLFFLFISTYSFSQELICNVIVNSNQIQTSDKQIFNSLQKSLYEFVNNTKWSDTKIENEERIECSIMINISKMISNDVFEGTLQIQSKRPIFGTSYQSTLFNYQDQNFKFNYQEFQPLEFTVNTHLSNLTSVIAFYVNIILGLDFSTFSEDGGMQYFGVSQKIVNNAQNVAEKGWRAFESDRNRYWLAYDLADPRYTAFQRCLYAYHRLGLDKLAEEPDDARFEITEALESLKDIYRENPSSFLLKLFFDAKSDEIVKIYSEAFPNEQARIVKTLVEIDPTNSSKYQKILNSNQEK